MSQDQSQRNHTGINFPTALSIIEPVLFNMKPFMFHEGLLKLLLGGGGNGTHYGILAWEIAWSEEPAKLQSTGLQRVGRDLVIK